MPPTGPGKFTHGMVRVMTPDADPTAAGGPNSSLLTPDLWEVGLECLDAAAASEVWGELCRRLDVGPHVIDLAAVRFADSVGLALLARAHARYRGRVWVVNVSDQLQKCLDRAHPNTLPPAVVSSRPRLGASRPAAGERLRGAS